LAKGWDAQGQPQIEPKESFRFPRDLNEKNILDKAINHIILWLYGETMNKAPLSDQMIEEAGRIFSALSDPSRLKLLRLLMASPEPMSQGVLAEAAGLSQANTSKHLVCLLQAGLVVRAREGNLVYFRLAGPLVTDACRLVKEHVTIRMNTAYKTLG
jgi:DNA-binding transcriptional ArsR family regulator